MLRIRPRALPVPATVLAWPVAVGSLALAVAALVLHASTVGGLRDTTNLHLADLWLSMLGPTVGAAVVARDRRTGLVLLGTAPIAVGAVAGGLRGVVGGGGRCARRCRRGLAGNLDLGALLSCPRCCCRSSSGPVPPPGWVRRWLASSS